MEKFNNAFINKYKKDIDVLSYDYPTYFEELLLKFNIPINRNKVNVTLLDWQQVKNRHRFYFDYVGSDSVVTNLFLDSQLASEKNVIIEFGYHMPVILVKTRTFILHWYDFFAASAFMGITVISENGKYFMEFTDNQFYLYSNFLIKK